MEGNVVRGKILAIGKFCKWRSQTKKSDDNGVGRAGRIWIMTKKYDGKAKFNVVSCLVEGGHDEHTGLCQLLGKDFL